MLRKAGQCGVGGGGAGGVGGQAGGAGVGPAAGGVLGAEWSERFFYLSGHFLRYKKHSLNLTSVNFKQVNVELMEAFFLGDGVVMVAWGEGWGMRDGRGGGRGLLVVAV